MPYHINPSTGEAGACRAKKKCPFGGEENHFQDKEEARLLYENEMEKIVTLRNGPIRESAATAYALTAPMSYSGPQPKWLKKINKSTGLMKDLFGTEKELIDVLDSPLGQLAVVWEKNGTRANQIHSIVESGYAISNIEYYTMDKGELVARVGATYTTDETIKQAYGDDKWAPFRHIADRKSFYGMKTQYPDRSVKDEAKMKSFKKEYFTRHELPDLSNPKEKFELFRQLSTHYDRWGNLNEEDYTSEQLDTKIEEYRLRAEQDLEDFRKNYSKSAYIDYITIEHPRLQGKGFGASLYIFMARKLGEQGLPLHESGIQTHLAEKAWRRMAADTRIPMKVARWVYQERGRKLVNARYSIDYTT